MNKLINSHSVSFSAVRIQVGDFTEDYLRISADEWLIKYAGGRYIPVTNPIFVKDHLEKTFSSK